MRHIRAIDRAPTRRKFLALLSATTLAGCGGDKPPPTTSLRFMVDADELINPNKESQPSPTLVRIYELKTLTNFQQASFFELLDNDTTVLGQDMVAKREIEIKPGERQAFERATPVDTHFIGAIAGFTDLDKATWRANLEIVTQQTGLIVVKLTAQAVSINLTRDKTLGLF